MADDRWVILAERLRAIGRNLTIEELALPIAESPERADVLADFGTLYALVSARKALATRADIESGGLDRLVDLTIGADAGRRSQLERLEAAALFTFVEPVGANWEIGRLIAAALGRAGDFAIVAPVATWVVRITQRTEHAIDEIVPRLSGAVESERGARGWRRWFQRRGWRV